MAVAFGGIDGIGEWMNGSCVMKIVRWRVKMIFSITLLNASQWGYSTHRAETAQNPKQYAQINTHAHPYIDLLDVFACVHLTQIYSQTATVTELAAVSAELQHFYYNGNV